MEQVKITVERLVEQQELEFDKQLHKMQQRLNSKKAELFRTYLRSKEEKPEYLYIVT